MAPPCYTDINVRWQADQNLLDVVETGIDLGYERMAINYFVESLHSRKGKKSEKASIPAPSDILLNKETVRDLQLKCPSFEQLSRITAVLQDASNTHRLGSPEVQAYDIIAVQTVNEKTFKLACSTLEVDIISLNLSESLGFSLRRPLVNVAVKRGIHFEILYSPALKDNTMKRNIISNAMTLVNASGGKNIILSSGSEQAIDLRSPYDVINLAKLFGLSHSQAKDAVCKNCRAVLKHAELRKTCKSVVSVINTSSLAPKDQWIIQHQNLGNRKRTKVQTGEDTIDSESEEETNEDSDVDNDGEKEGNKTSSHTGNENSATHSFKAKKVKL